MPIRTSPLRTFAIASLLLAAATTPSAAGPAGGPDPVHAQLETRAVFDDDAGGFADTDDPAIWVHPDNPRHSIVIVTEKQGGLTVFDLEGQVLQEVDAPAPPRPGDAPGRFNNVDLVRGFWLGALGRVDLAIVSDRGLDQIRSYRIDPADAAVGQAPLTDVTAPDVPFVFSADQDQVNTEETAYGLATWHDDGKASAFVSRNNHPTVAQARLRPTTSGLVTYEVLDTIGLPSSFTLPDGTSWTPCGDPGELPQVEGMVVDRDRSVLYAAQESVGIWRIPIGPWGPGEPTLIDKVREYGVPWTFDPVEEECLIDFAADPGFGGEHLSADVEGLTIYHDRWLGGYLLASSQGDNTFAAYGRWGRNPHRGSFQVVDGSATDEVQECDGADVTNADLGGEFDDGLLVVQDGANTPDVLDEDGEPRDNTNVKFVAWDDVAESIG